MLFKISRIGHSRGRPVARGFGKCGLDHAPLIGQIGLVSLDGAAMLSSSSWRPPGESKLVQETAWNHGGRRCVNLSETPLTRAERTELGHRRLAPQDRSGAVHADVSR